MATGNKKSKLILEIQTKASEDKIKKLEGTISELESKLKKLDSTSSKYTSTLKMYEKAEKSLNSEIRKHTKLVDQSIVSEKNSINATQQKINALRKQMNAMDMNSDKFKTASADMRQLSASMLEGSSATGLHAASAMELGRVFSDAPYGIRGVANNISQLGSLMAQAAQTTDKVTGKAIGFGGAINGLAKSLMGPLGILLAFQAVIAIIETFSDKIGKANNLLSDISEEGITTATTKLGLLVRATNDSNVALDQKQEMVRRANEEMEGLNASLDENGNLTQDSIANIQAMTTEFSKMAKAAAVVELIKDLNRELMVMSIQGTRSLAWWEQTLSFVEGALTGNFMTIAASQAQQLFGNMADIFKQGDDLYNLGKDQEFLPHVFGEESKNGGGARGRRVRNFKKMIFDLSKEILSMDRNIELSQEKNVVKRLEIESKFAREDLKLKQKQFVERQTKRVTDLEEKEKENRVDLQREIKQTKAILEARKKAFKDMLTKGGASSKDLEDASLGIKNDEAKLANQQATLDKSFNLTAKARKKLNEMIKQSKKELNRALTKEEEEHLVEMIELERSIREQAAIDSQAAELKRVASHLELLAGLIDENDPNSLASLQEKQREVWAIEDEAFAIDQERKRQKLQDADYTEQEISQILHDEKMARDSVRKGEEVDLEIATIEAKKKAQLEYVGWVASIGSTMKKLSKDNEGLAKAALLVEKGAATAKVIIETQKSNAAITALAGARTMAGDPVAVKQAKILKLKNNIGAGLAIANIWATSTASRSNPDGGSGSGGGGNTFNPNFNVVGNSETNQLAESIGGQVNQPNRAYVVYEDIQNATELNANAVESSGI